MSRRAARFTQADVARVQTIDAATLLGLSPRTVQGLAAQGLLPGAAKIGTKENLE